MKADNLRVEAESRYERSDLAAALAAVCTNFGTSVPSVFHGEFDSGSERTLAAWIRHASRTGVYW